MTMVKEYKTLLIRPHHVLSLNVKYIFLEKS